MSSPELDALRQRMRAFLESNCRRITPDDDAPSLIADTGPDPDEPMKLAREFQRECYDAGFAGLEVPREYGGQGLGEPEEAAWRQESAPFAVPNLVPISVGIRLAVPTILTHGREDQKIAHVGPTLRADQVWCQLFSEPDAGSDLASLRTRALLDGDDFVVTGHKVWTSFAMQAHYGLLLARTEPGSRGHAGLTLFVLDMSSDGVDVRPLREMTGGTHFNEVILDGVRVPAAQAIGAPGDGWRVAMTTLGNERGGAGPAGRPRWRRLAAVADAEGRLDDPIVRASIADLAMRERVLAWTARRFATGNPGPESSILKLAAVLVEQQAALLAMTARGPAVMAWDRDDDDTRRLTHWMLGSRANSLAGGTDQVQRNIIAERVLGLPREPRPVTP